MKKLSKREEKAFTRYLFKQNFIEEGSGREVYSFRTSFVIKVAKNKNGLIQNKNEVVRYKKYGGEKLAKIVAYSKKLVIMERVDEDIDITMEQRNQFAVWLNDICECESEDHWESLGSRKNGDIVCYDYGDSENIYTKSQHKDLAIREYIASQGADDLVNLKDVLLTAKQVDQLIEEEKNAMKE